MSQMENMAVPAVGNMSKEELLELKKAMNAKALAKRRTRTALRKCGVCSSDPASIALCHQYCTDAFQ